MSWRHINQQLTMRPIAVFTAAMAVAMLAIWTAAQPLVPADRGPAEAGFLLFVPGPLLPWTAWLLPLVLSLP